MRASKLLVDGSARSARALRGWGGGHESQPAPDFCEPRDAWWRLEDLFLRIAAIAAVSVHVDGDNVRIVVHGIARLREPRLDELRRAVRNLRTYAWQTDGARGSYVRTVERHGSDLVCTLVSRVQIERWPEGEQLYCEVQRFLIGLGRRRPVDGGWQ